MANTDSMTGVRNKHAYMETEAQLNSWIREGAVEKLAVIACDINGLKYVNDTKGHAAGDQLIKLMTLGLTEKEAEEQIVNGFLK